jgi:hypothetical protein
MSHSAQPHTDRSGRVTISTDVLGYAVEYVERQQDLSFESWCIYNRHLIF